VRRRSTVGLTCDVVRQCDAVGRTCEVVRQCDAVRLSDEPVTWRFSATLSDCCVVADSDIGEYYCTMKLANGDRLKHVVNLNGNMTARLSVATSSSNADYLCFASVRPSVCFMWPLAMCGIYGCCKLSLRCVDVNNATLRETCCNCHYDAFRLDVQWLWDHTV